MNKYKDPFKFEHFRSMGKFIFKSMACGCDVIHDFEPWEGSTFIFYEYVLIIFYEYVLINGC